MSLLHELGQAVVNLIEGAEFAAPLDELTFTTRLTYDAEKPLTELAELDVAVMPATSRWQMETRGMTTREPVINIAIRQQCRPDDQDKIDQLIALGEAIGDLLEDHPRLAMFSWSGGAALTNIELAIPYSAAMLREKGLFMCVLAATYSVQRRREQA